MRVLRLLVGIGAAIPLATLTTALSSAGAASAEQVRTSCEHFVSNGNGFQQGTLSGCSHESDTGGSGSFVVNVKVGGIVITWESGKTTDVNNLYITQPTQDEPENNSCPSNAPEYLWHGTIASDTTGSIPVGGNLSGEVCIDFSAGTSNNERYARVTFT
jgi:hypothetical protein